MKDRGQTMKDNIQQMKDKIIQVEKCLKDAKEIDQDFFYYKERAIEELVSCRKDMKKELGELLIDRENEKE